MDVASDRDVLQIPEIQPRDQSFFNSITDDDLLVDDSLFGMFGG